MCRISSDRFAPRGLHHKVVVIAHQAVSQHLRVEALQPLFDDGQQRRQVFVVREDALAPVATRCDVVHGTWKFNAQRAGHQGAWSTSGGSALN